MPAEWNDFWKENWDVTRERFSQWWQHKGLILSVTAPADVPRTGYTQQQPLTGLHSGIDTRFHIGSPCSLEDAWLDAERRTQIAEAYIAGIYYGGESIPYFDTHIGPGSLALFLGARAEFANHTVWYYPCISDLNTHPALVFDPENSWFQKQTAILETGMRAAHGHFLVGMPDVIENIDILASLRGTQDLLFDMLDRPEFIPERIQQINQAYFSVFEHFYNIIKDPWGGNTFSAFDIWGPGKTAKVQCDAGAMISPDMMGQFVIPALKEQCAWLDYSMYHLDGTQAIVQLDQLLAIDELDAIEWTPQAGLAGGGDPTWYDLYRRILDGGKSVQAVGVKPEEVVPLLDAIGSQGVFLMVAAHSEAEARALEEAVEPYR